MKNITHTNMASKINTEVNKSPYDLRKSSKIREDNERLKISACMKKSPYDLNNTGFKGFK